MSTDEENQHDPGHHQREQNRGRSLSHRQGNRSKESSFFFPSFDLKEKIYSRQVS